MKSPFADLTTALQTKVEPIPKGWATAKQIADSIGRGITFAHKALAVQVKNGSYECREFRCLDILGRVRPTPHYRKAK